MTHAVRHRTITFEESAAFAAPLYDMAICAFCTKMRGERYRVHKIDIVDESESAKDDWQVVLQAYCHGDKRGSTYRVKFKYPPSEDDLTLAMKDAVFYRDSDIRDYL